MVDDFFGDVLVWHFAGSLDLEDTRASRFLLGGYIVLHRRCNLFSIHLGPFEHLKLVY